MNTEKLFELLTSHANLSPKLKDEISQLLREEYYKSHQILHAAGQVENRAVYVESGFLRSYYYDHNGNEHTVRFWQEGDILFSYEGYYSVPSFFYTEIVHEACLLTLNYNNVHAIERLFPEMAILIKSQILKYQQEEFEHQKLLTLTSQERYKSLHQSSKLLFQRIPIRMIASYLNMTRETLTRLIGKH